MTGTTFIAAFGGPDPWKRTWPNDVRERMMYCDFHQDQRVKEMVYFQNVQEMVRCMNAVCTCTR